MKKKQFRDPEVKHLKGRLKTKSMKKMIRVRTCHLTDFEQRKEKVYLCLQKKKGTKQEKMCLEKPKMSETNEDKEVPSLHNTTDIENKSAKCKFCYGGSEMFTQIKRNVLLASSLIKKNKTLKRKSFQPVMSDDEVAQAVKHLKTSYFWSMQITVMKACQSFEGLVHHLWSMEFPEFIPEFHTEMCASDLVDKISQKLYPHNAPQEPLPRFASVDGNLNCLIQKLVSLSGPEDFQLAALVMLIWNSATVMSFHSIWLICSSSS